jgi:hypothetical protein
MKIVVPMTKRIPAYLILAVLAMTAMGSVVVYAAISNFSASTVTTVGGGIRVFTEQSALTPQGISMSTATGLTQGNSDLGDIEEGETKSYTKATVSTLGNVINIATTEGNVYLHFDSDVDSLSTYYTTYAITVKYSAVGNGSSHAVGDTACTMTLESPDPPAVTLDKAGTWRFDFEITTTAKSVSSDQPTTVTIVVRASS